MLKKILKNSTIVAGALALSCGIAFMANASTDKTDLSQFISLNVNATIEGEYVRLGDLFNGLAEHRAKQVISRAPEPGKQIVVDAYTLARVAHNYAVDWQPASQFDEIVVERSATLVGNDEIIAPLHDALAGQMDGAFKVDLGGRQYSVVMPLSDAINVSVQNININRTRGSFSATLDIENGKGEKKSLTVTGRAVNVVEIPVLANRADRTTVIGKNDIEWVEVEAQAVPMNVITDPTQIIGMIPRRGLAALSPIRYSDVEAPDMVKKGEIVTVNLSNGHLKLTMKGRALDDGAKGETIRIVNTASNKVVQGVVTGYQTVQTDGFDTMAAVN